MARSVHQILGLLGTKDAATVSVYRLPLVPPAPAQDIDRPATHVATDAVDRAAAWVDVWGADFGRLTASVTAAEKDALVAAGAREQPARF
ncbi:MAG TPA: hypothetical protein VM261_25245 [Kofleriaceae bacterium]|nr:hypothetical protein [Kofleriaceae bacterium]